MEEYVAKAMHGTQLPGATLLGLWDNTTQPYQQKMCLLARAAITAIREPTTEMLVAGGRYIEDCILTDSKRAVARHD